MAEIKRSKKNVLMASLLIFLLSITFVALQITPVSTSTTVHDVAVTNVDILFYNATAVYPDWPFNVTVKNYGTETETFDVVVYVYDVWKFIGPKMVENLAPGESETLTFNWTTVSSLAEKWPYTEHRIVAIAGWYNPVPGDTNYYNNYFYDFVTLRWPGDANGDGHIDEADLELISDHYGGKFPDPLYNATADMNGDGVIDILDACICGLNYHNGPCDMHDVAVTGIIPVTYPTWNNNFYLTFGITVQNRGWHQSETFDVTIYNGTNLIGTKTVTDLASRAEKLVTITLEGQQSLPGYLNDSSAAWPYPTHTIWAKASKVNGEYDTTDNTYGNVTVTVRWTGDANGDGHVNQTDNDIVSDFFGKEFPDPNYNASADFNGDGIVDDADSGILEDRWHTGPLDYCDMAVTLNYVIFHLYKYPWVVWNPSIVYPGWPLDFYVTVKNNGNNTENKFTLTAYANTTIIGTKDFNLDIAPGASRSVSFTGIIPSVYGLPNEWPYPYPIYNITVSLTIPCNESLENNEDSYGIVTVWCPGDTNGDGYLNETDLSNMSSAIELFINGIYCDWHAEFNGNGKIDLDDVQQLISDDRWKQGPRPPDPDP